MPIVVATHANIDISNCMRIDDIICHLNPTHCHPYMRNEASTLLSCLFKNKIKNTTSFNVKNQHTCCIIEKMIIF